METLEQTPIGWLLFQFFDTIKLALTIASTHGASIVVSEPANQMMCVSAVLAPHAPSEPFGKRKTGQGR